MERLENICCFCYDGDTKGKAPIGRLLLHTIRDLTARVGSRAVISFLLLMCSVLLIAVASFRFSARFEVEEVVSLNLVVLTIFSMEPLRMSVEVFSRKEEGSCESGRR